MGWTYIYFLFLLFVSCCRINKVFGRDGEIYARTASSGKEWSDRFPIRIHSLSHTIPAEKSEANIYGLVDFSNDDGCYQMTGFSNVNDRKNKIIAVSDADNHCTISKKVMVAQEMGAGGILIVLSIKVYHSHEFDSTSENNIIVASINKQDFLEILSTDAPIEVILISPDIPSFDPSVIFIFLFAMTCIIVGGLWAGQSTATRMNTQRKRPSVSTTQSSRTNDTNDGKVCNCIICMCSLFGPLLGAITKIVLLYHFYNIMVYVVIVLFGLLGSATLFISLRELFNQLPWSLWIPKSRISVFKISVTIIIGLLSIGIAIFWGIHRNEDYSWVIQNIFGMIICVNVIRGMEYQTLTSGESIMMKIATGGSFFGSTNLLAISQGEQIPIVFKVPALGEYPINVIASYTLLGFGDIIIPAYGLGLVMTFVGMALMKRGQPALLYIAPSTLVTTLVIGYIRGEIRSLFYGITQQSTSNEAETQDTEMTPVEAAKTDANVEIALLRIE